MSEIDNYIRKTCNACAYSGMEPDDMTLTCYHPDAGMFGQHIWKEPLDHCGFQKFEQHPSRNTDGPLVASELYDLE